MPVLGYGKGAQLNHALLTAWWQQSGNAGHCLPGLRQGVFEKRIPCRRASVGNPLIARRFPVVMPLAPFQAIVGHLQANAIGVGKEGRVVILGILRVALGFARFYALAA